jgi:hypothetical protein
MTALSGVLVALLAGLFPGAVPGLSTAGNGGTPTVSRTATTSARTATQPQGAVLTHQVRADRDTGGGPGLPAACPPAAAVVVPVGAAAAVTAGLPLGGGSRSERCVDGRAPPAAAALAVPLSLG